MLFAFKCGADSSRGEELILAHDMGSDKAIRCDAAAQKTAVGKGMITAEHQLAQQVLALISK